MRVPKRPFAFLQGNIQFYSCNQTAIRFFIAKYKILKTVPKRLFIFTTKYKILKVVPKRPLVYP